MPQPIINDSFSDVLGYFQSSTQNNSSGLLSQISTEAGRTLSTQASRRILSNEQIDFIIRDDSIVERINSIIPFEATKLLPELRNTKYSNKLQTMLEDGDWLAKFRRAGRLANRYGAAYIILDIHGDLDPSVPLSYKTRYIVDDAKIVTHKECRPVFNEFQESYDEPQLYQLTINGNISVIHQSRILCFYGREKTGDELRLSCGYHEPLWSSAYSKLLSYLEANSAALNMLKDSSVGVYKLKGLHERLAEAASCPENEQEANTELYKRLSLLVDSVSVINKLIIDLENEEYEYVERNYTGVNTILADLRRTFIEYAPLPASILFQSVESSGMFADTSGGDREILAMSVLKYQIEQMLPNFKKLFKVLEPRASGYTIDFPSTVHYTLKEQASILFDLSKSLSALVASQIITPQMAAKRLETRQLRVVVDLTPEEVKKISDNFETQQPTSFSNIAGSRGSQGEKNSN